MTVFAEMNVPGKSHQPEDTVLGLVAAGRIDPLGVSTTVVDWGQAARLHAIALAFPSETPETRGLGRFVLLQELQESRSVVTPD